MGLNCIFELDSLTFSMADRNAFGVGGKLLFVMNACFGLGSGDLEAGFKGDGAGRLELRGGGAGAAMLVSTNNGGMARFGRCIAFPLGAEL